MGMVFYSDKILIMDILDCKEVINNFYGKLILIKANE